MLFNEGADRNRTWDIAVNDELAVDNFNSEGGDQIWNTSNGFAYSGDFTATADGTIAIKMQNDLGGAAHPGGDGNPILQGIVIHANAVAIENIFGFEAATFERIYASQATHRDASPYDVLGLTREASDDDIKSTYRNLAREHHPDLLMAQGMPQEFIDVANGKLAAINDAYARIRRERGMK